MTALLIPSESIRQCTCKSIMSGHSQSFTSPCWVCWAKAILDVHSLPVEEATWFPPTPLLSSPHFPYLVTTPSPLHSWWSAPEAVLNVFKHFTKIRTSNRGLSNSTSVGMYSQCRDHGNHIHYHPYAHSFVYMWSTKPYTWYHGNHICGIAINYH